MRRGPTEKQARLLRVLAGGCIAIAPYRREWMPLVRREWVETTKGEHIVDEPGMGTYLPPLRITSAGLRALADATDGGIIEPVELKPVGSAA